MAKILIVAGQIDSLIRFRGELLDELLKLGYQVYTVAGDKNDHAKNLLEKKGIEYRQINFSRVGVNPFADLKYLYNLWVFIREVKPDVMLCYTIKPVVYGILCGFLARISRRYALITGLGYAFIEQPGKKWKIINLVAINLYRTGLLFANCVFFQNHDDNDFFKSKKIVSSAKPTYVVHGSGVNLDYFSQEKLPETPVFILIARLLKDKGIFEYIEAAREIIKIHPGTRFYLVGPMDNNPSAITKEELDRWSNEGIIHYVGAVDDVRPWIKKSSILVLPSYREGTPRSVLEAMSMGRPIITTDVPGCRETVVQGQNGILVPAKNSYLLHKAMLKLIKDRELREYMGENSRKIACSKFNVHNVNNFMLRKMDLDANVK